jgi:hypothetical protein
VDAVFTLHFLLVDPHGLEVMGMQVILNVLSAVAAIAQILDFAKRQSKRLPDAGRVRRNRRKT